MPSNNTFFGLAAGLLSVIAFVPYVRSIFRGRTKPSVASWWTWTALTLVTVTSSWSAGASFGVLILPMWLCFSQLFIALLSIKRGDTTWDRINKISISGAVAGVLLWLFTGQPLTAMVASIIADLFATVPTLRHAWSKPYEENRLGWSLGWGSAGCALLSMDSISFAESSWVIYFFAAMTVVALLVWRPAFSTLRRNPI